jgi:hypothetical protein
VSVEWKIEIGAEQSKVEYALPGLEHDRRAADSAAAGTGAGERAGHDSLHFHFVFPVALARPRVRNGR